MFKDIEGRWSTQSIKRVASCGIMGGYPDGTFKPAQQITREEIASIFDRYMFRDGVFHDILPGVMPSIVCVNARTNLGSGACVAKTAQYSYVLTNNHVAGGKTTFDLIKEGEPNFRGEHVIADVMKDLALIRTTRRMVPIPLAEAGPELGQPVAVVGAPAGLIESVSVGVVSHLNREGGKWYQTDAPINPGNSGGPVINEKGEMVGVAVAKLVGEAFEGIGYAIKLEHVKQFLAQVAEKIV